MAKYQVKDQPSVRIFEGTPEEFLVGVTKATIERIFSKNVNPADCLALYCFYAYTAKWQGNVCAYATTPYVMKKFGWGKDRLLKAKGTLRQLGLIEDEKRTDKVTKKVLGWFVKVRYAQSTGTEIHPPDLPPGGFPHTETHYSHRETLNSQEETLESDDETDKEQLLGMLEKLRKELSPQQPNTKR